METIKRKEKERKGITARTPEGVENQLIGLAIDYAAKKLLDGTASSQIVTHFLKLATTKEKLENEKLRADLRVADAKIKRMEQQTTSQKLYEEAIKAFKSYSGNVDEDEDDYDE